MSPPRILIADDHTAVIEQLRELLAGEFEVVGAVGDGGALLAAVSTLRPDAIVSDITMPVLDGIAAAREILQRDADARVVLVTVHADRALVEASLRLGVLGYVLKATAGEELVSALHAALGGRRYLSAGIRAATAP